MQYRDGNENLLNIVENVFLHRNFTIFFQGRDEIFSCGFHHNMCPSSGWEYLKAFPSNPYRKKVMRKNLGGFGSPPPWAAEDYEEQNSQLYITSMP